jgi:hypothetical protein
MLAQRYLRLRPDAKGKSVVSSNSKLIELQPRTGLKKPAAAAPSALVHLSIVGYARPRMRRKCAGILRRKGSIFSHIRRQCGYPVH